MTLHLLLHPERAAVASAIMDRDDTLILGAGAVALAGNAWPARSVYALAEDCRHWGFTPITVETISDLQWVDHAAAAERIIHW